MNLQQIVSEQELVEKLQIEIGNITRVSIASVGVLLAALKEKNVECMNLDIPLSAFKWIRTVYTDGRLLLSTDYERVNDGWWMDITDLNVVELLDLHQRLVVELNFMRTKESGK